MTEYRVIIELDIESSSPEAAALAAESIIHNDPPPFYVYARDELLSGGIDRDSVVVVDISQDGGSVWRMGEDGEIEVLDWRRYEESHRNSKV